MEKVIILVRHAKSDWAEQARIDFERPLNKRGRKDAPAMAQRLLEKKLPADAIISSPAARAAATASVFADTLQLKVDYKDELYLAEPETFFNIISALTNSLNCVVIVSHNNGLTDFANMLTNARIDNIPTCGVFAIKVDCAAWAAFGEAKKEFLFFDYPKNL